MSTTTDYLIKDKMELLAHVYGYSLSIDHGGFDLAGGSTTYYRFRADPTRFAPTVTVFVRDCNGAYNMGAMDHKDVPDLTNHTRRDDPYGRGEVFWLANELDEPFDRLTEWFKQHSKEYEVVA